MSNTSTDWLDAQKTAMEAMTIARNAAAAERANRHLTMLLLTTVAKTAPAEAVDQLYEEIERIRDLSGPAGAVANEIFATAITTIERYQQQRD
jgi:hypothetical protein